MDKETALRRFTKSRQHFRQAIRKMSEEEILTIPVEGVWTAKDLIGHLTSWERLLLEPLHSLANGGEFKPEIISDHDLFNSNQAAGWQAWSLVQVVADADATRNQLLAALASITEEQCQRIYPAPWGGSQTIPHLVDGLRWHEDDHRKCIHHWVKRKGTKISVDKG